MRTGLSARLGSGLPITLAAVLLFVVSPLVSVGSLHASALATMIPFASILAVTAIGQTLVIQQGGLDFSVPGTISLAAVVLTKTTQAEPARLFWAIPLVLLLGIVVGCFIGFLIVVLKVAPLIATLGVNALVLGTVQQSSGGLSVPPAPESLNSFALGRTLGLFNLLIIAVLLIVATTFIIKKTVFGRRFEAVGTSEPVAQVVGLSVGRYKTIAYASAGFTYALAGVMLAGFLRTPGLDIGNSYLLASIAAVVLGGTALTGGVGSVAASGIAALFLTQLSQLLLALGAQTSVIYLIQGLAIGAGMGIRILMTWVTDSRSRHDAYRLTPETTLASIGQMPDGQNSNLLISAPAQTDDKQSVLQLNLRRGIH